MSAYGFAISVITQINNYANNPRIADSDGPNDAAEKKREEKRERMIDKRKRSNKRK